MYALLKNGDVIMPVLPLYRNQSICCANQLTGFYMRETLVLTGVTLE